MHRVCLIFSLVDFYFLIFAFFYLSKHFACSSHTFGFTFQFVTFQIQKNPLNTTESQPLYLPHTHCGGIVTITEMLYFFKKKKRSKTRKLTGINTQLLLTIDFFFFF